MNLSAGNDCVVECIQIPGAGSPWVVRVFRKRFLLKRRISSDWFLDEKQARAYAGTLAALLRDGGSVKTIVDRKPGWSFRRHAG